MTIKLKLWILCVVVLFAVVADEVRKLAEKTMVATKKVADAIAGIQRGLQRNIQAMDETSESIIQSADLVLKARELLLEIEAVVEGDNGPSQFHCHSCRAAEEINAATDEVNRITSETAEGVRRSVDAINSVASLATDLQEVIRELK